MTAPSPHGPVPRLAGALALALFAACAASVSTLRFPEATAHDFVPAPIDVLHYAIELDLHPEERSIDGTCHVRLRSLEDGLDTVRLHLEGLAARSVSSGDGRALEHVQRDGELVVRLDRPLAADGEVELAIDYGGRPRTGLWFVEDAGARPRHVFSQGECEDSRYWFPCHDVPFDRATSELAVEMPAGWVAIAAGVRLERRVEGGRAHERWRMDERHPAYLVTLVAGDLVETRDDSGPVPLVWLAPPEHAEHVEPVFAETPRILEVVGGIVDEPYPYPKYGQACVGGYPYGGMENVSATTLTDEILTDERGRRDDDALDLLVHEAAHQWFGDLLTCRDWGHIWLNESFATYLELLYVERTRGVDAFREALWEAQASYLEEDVGEDRRPTVWNVYKDPDDLFSGHVYPGGAARLHLLRHVVGDEDFFGGLAAYVDEFRDGSVVTDDFQAVMSRVADADLGWFFDSWIRRAGFPEFRVEWSWDEERRLVVVDVAQVQPGLRDTPRVFRTPVEIEVRGEDGATLHRLEVDERRERFELEADARPSWVRFDKHGWIPKRISSEKAVAEWLRLCAGDDDLNGRRMAAEALGGGLEGSLTTQTRELVVEALVERLRADPSGAVRAAAAAALAGQGFAAARDALVAASSHDASADVRVAALEALREWCPDGELAAHAERVFDAGYSYATMGAAAALRADAAPEGAFAWILDRSRIPSPHDALLGRLAPVIADLGHPRGVAVLAGWASDREVGQRGRRFAAKELGRFASNDPLARATLVELLEDPHPRVRRMAIEGLETTDTSEVRAALARMYRATVDPLEMRAIEAAFERKIPRR